MSLFIEHYINTCFFGKNYNQGQRRFPMKENNSTDVIRLIFPITEAYLEPNQTFTKELFAKIVKGQKLLTTLANELHRLR